MLLINSCLSLRSYYSSSSLILTNIYFLQKVTKQLDNDSDIDDDQRHDQELELMRKHAEQRIAILQGEKIELEDEMEGVSIATL